jgi:tRNA(Ile)-lysidine synthase
MAVSTAASHCGLLRASRRQFNDTRHSDIAPMPHKKQKQPVTPAAANTGLAGAVLTDFKKRAVFRAGQRLGVGVSGGADSVALLFLLLELREELGIVLSVVHVNHKLRGRAADTDEQFVARLAAKHGLKFFCQSVNVEKKARLEKANVEDAARRARYEFFAQLVAEGKVDRVAVAHTADDQAETVLAHILRGTGLAGLGGIHREAENVVRPLLGVRRAELRAYLRWRKQKWREDATNEDTSRMRARIRKKLLPLLERNFQAGVVGHLCALAEFAREDEAFLDWLARTQCASSSKQDEDAARIAIGDLMSPMGKTELNTKDTEGITEGTEKKSKPERFNALTKRMVRRLIEERRKGSGQITAQHIAAVMELARHGENGKALQLPGGVEVRRERDDLVFCTNESHARPSSAKGKARGSEWKHPTDGTSDRAEADYEYKIDLKSDGATLRVPGAGCVLRLRVIDWVKKREDTSKSGAVLDRDRLRSPLALRNWRPGDRLQPTGHQKAHKLKRLLNEKHISRWEREGWPVLTSGGVLVWARGFPVAAGYAADERTREGILIAEETT